MRNLGLGGTKLAFFMAATALACSTSPARRVDAQRADASTQAVREDADEIPCAPRLVLQTICQQCHTLPPRNGAPFPLVRRSDILAPREGVHVRDLMIREVDAKRMPLTPVTIEPEARAVLLEWLRAGAPAVTPRQCDDAEADAGDELDAGDGATPTKPPADGCAGTCGDAYLDAGADGEAADADPE